MARRVLKRRFEDFQPSLRVNKMSTSNPYLPPQTDHSPLTPKVSGQRRIDTSLRCMLFNGAVILANVAWVVLVFLFVRNMDTGGDWLATIGNFAFWSMIVVLPSCFGIWMSSILGACSGISGLRQGHATRTAYAVLLTIVHLAFVLGPLFYVWA